MLRLDIKGILQDRQIIHPSAFLMKQGFSQYTANRIINNKIKSISFRHLEKLCVIFHCTPTELFVWQPDGKASKNRSQPVQQLAPAIYKPLLPDNFHQLPKEKIIAVRQSIDEVLKNA